MDKFKKGGRDNKRSEREAGENDKGVRGEDDKGEG